MITAIALEQHQSGCAWLVVRPGAFSEWNLGTLISIREWGLTDLLPAAFFAQ